MIFEIKQKKKEYIENINSFVKKEMVLIIALILAIGTSIFSLPKLEYIDFRVLGLLFMLMLIVAAFKEIKLLDNMAISLLSKCKNNKTITLTLVLCTFISSMIVTNDVALITFVPITLIVGKKLNINPIRIIIIETLGANLGSILTPMGNPQNLFIYSFFNISPMEFFKITLPITIIALGFLLILIIRNKNVSYSINLEKVNKIDKREIFIYSILLLVILFSVFRLIDFRLSMVITVLVMALKNRKLFKEVDYSLLITFVCFFIFIGNISSMSIIRNILGDLLSTGKSTYFSSIVISQFISNVPATILMSGFTASYKSLLLGVNIGGMGTLIASLASVISYKLYVKENEGLSGKYLWEFTKYNIVGLIVLVPIFYFLII